MSLPRPSLLKLIRENLHATPPLQLSEAEWVEIARELASRLSALPGIHAQTTTSDRGSRQTSLDVGWSSRGVRWYGDRLFSLLRNEQGVLAIALGYGHTVVGAVGAIDEVVVLVHAMTDAIGRRQAQEEKRAKVRGFKAQAILATVRRIADEDGFTFQAGADARKLRLFVSLGGSDHLELQLPFADFQAHLPRLRETICVLKGLHAEGIVFHINRTPPRSRDVQWSHPERPEGHPR